MPVLLGRSCCAAAGARRGAVKSGVLFPPRTPLTHIWKWKSWAFPGCVGRVPPHRLQSLFLFPSPATLTPTVGIGMNKYLRLFFFFVFIAQRSPVLEMTAQKPDGVKVLKQILQRWVFIRHWRILCFIRCFHRCAEASLCVYVKNKGEG